ncbi:MAG: hypothetical protein ABI456_16160 [Ktedonobacteraceae bacterium]
MRRQQRIDKIGKTDALLSSILKSARAPSPLERKTDHEMESMETEGAIQLSSR